MKKITIYYWLVCFVIAACNPSPHQQATQLAEKIQAAHQAYGPPSVSTSRKGYFMKALINGQPWSAKEMLQFDRKINDYRVLGANGETKIAFNIHLYDLNEGEVLNFGEAFAADLFTGDEIGLWAGRKGMIKITKKDGKIVTGTFHFTATTHQDPDKKIEVKDGFFRVILK